MFCRRRFSARSLFAVIVLVNLCLIRLCVCAAPSSAAPSFGGARRTRATPKTNSESSRDVRDLRVAANLRRSQHLSDTANWTVLVFDDELESTS